MTIRLFTHLKSLVHRIVTGLAERLREWTQPLRETLVGGAVVDVTKSKRELLAENALLRQQLIVLKRHVKQVKLKGRERLLVVVLASRVRAWRQASQIWRKIADNSLAIEGPKSS